MRIRRIELQGFKSFVDKTVLQLSPGICSIVGPNGAGKSNIIDAIKWTLGEQRATTLRGKAMEDVIFAGSADRPPAGRAEVTIVFDNADGAFGGRYARFEEVQVSRRLDRSGRSGYAINKTAARLKDVVDLFLDSGVGARGYSIIEQGRVGFVVNSKSDERRELIDEVAGINRFKAQRIESERRMHATRENLLRVRDLLGELGRQRGTLQRAARKATRYRELRSQWKAATLHVLAGQALHEAGRAQQEQDALAGLIGQETRLGAQVEERRARSREQELAAQAARGEHEALVSARSDLDRQLALRRREHQFRAEELRGLAGRSERVDADLLDFQRRAAAAAESTRSTQQELTRAREEMARVEAAVSQAGEQDAAHRADARARRRALEAAKAGAIEARSAAARARSVSELLGRQIVQAARSLAEHDDRAASRVAARGELERRAEDSERVALRRAEAWRRSEEGAGRASAALEAAKQAARGTRARRDDVRRELEGEQARLRSLRELLDGLAGFGDGVRSFLSAHGASADVLGPVAELLRVPDRLEGAVEAALGPLLQAVVVRPGALDRLADWVEAQGLERIALVVPDPERSATGLAAEVVSTVPGLGEALLGGIELGAGPRSVSPSGRLRDGGVLWVGRHTGSGEGVLARRRDAERLAGLVQGLESRLDAVEAEASRAAAAVVQAESALQNARSELHTAELRSLEGRRDRDEGRRALERAAKEEADASATRAAQQAQHLAWQGEREAAQAERQERDREGGEREQEAASLREGLAAVEARVAEAASTANALRVEHAALQQQAAGRLRDLRRLEAESADVARRLARAEADRVAVAARRAQLDSDLVRLSGVAETLEAELAQADEQLAAAEARRTRDEAARTAGQQALTELQGTLDGLRNRRLEHEVQLAQAQASLQGLADRAADEFDLKLGPLLHDVVESGSVRVDFRGEGEIVLQPAALAAERLPAHARDAAALGRKLDGIGPVNLAAPTEYEELSGRFVEIQEQNDDLEKALADLKRAIARIEKETRDRFLDAFERVAERFSALYPRLVGGGRAELRLTEPDALLETGVDVVVEPPGKRLQNLTLLSGGEKAMAAIALVFALFQVKPSPFCLLDEVDAPLDEANSRRFNETLREMAAETQFVVITHNRTTMEVADVLYGVTMQRPGVSCLVSVRLDELDEGA